MSQQCDSKFLSYGNPCDVQVYIMSSLTSKQIQTQELFIWVITFAGFFGTMFLSFMVTQFKNAKVKKAKAKLAVLDVNPGITIYKNADGAKLVQKKKKNMQGGAASIVIIFGIIVLVAYVLATEFDQPGELGFQRRLIKSTDGKIIFKSTALEEDRAKLKIEDSHNLDLGFIFDSSFPVSDPYFVSSAKGICMPTVHHCSEGSQRQFISTTYDFWATPTVTDYTLCGTLEQRAENQFSFFSLSPAIGDGGFRTSAMVFDEALNRWDTSSALDVLPKFEITVSAVTAYRLSVFLADYIVPPPRLHKVRVDDIVTRENITTNVCPNPIAQFTVIGSHWEINGIYIVGLSTVVISAIGAAGTLFGVRTTIKSAFESIANYYNASIKKKRVLMITGYSIQTIFGVAAPVLIFVSANFLIDFLEFSDRIVYSTFFIFAFAAVIFAFWILSTVIFSRNIRELNSKRQQDSSVADPNGSISYVMLEDQQTETN